MIVFNVTLLMVFILLVCKSPQNIRNGEKTDVNVMDKGSTSVIRGAAIIGIVLHHCSQYFDNLGVFQFPIMQSGYALTAIFFLLSGYGCYYSFQKLNNFNSRKEALKPVVLWTLQHGLRIYLDFLMVFVVNVVAYKLVGFETGMETKELIKDIFTITLPSWVNWYPKIQILCYVILAISFLISKKHKEILSFIAVFIYIFIVWKFDFASMWFTSVMCFPIGLFAAKFIPKINLSKGKYAVVLCASTIVFLALFYLQTKIYQAPLRFVSACVLSFIIISLTGLIKFDSKILKFIGNMSFEIYLVHSFMINVCLALKFNSDLSIGIILITTLILGLITNKLVVYIKNKIFININQ